MLGSALLYILQFDRPNATDEQNAHILCEINVKINVSVNNVFIKKSSHMKVAIRV